MALWVFKKSFWGDFSPRLHSASSLVYRGGNRSVFPESAGEEIRKDGVFDVCLYMAFLCLFIGQPERSLP